MKRFNWFGLMPMICAIVMAVTTPAWAADEIKIGMIGAMRFIYGQEQWNGAVMAAEEINAKGGVKVGNKQMKIKLIKAESNEVFSVSAAANAMEQLILRDKADIVIGGITSEATLAMQDVAMDNKTIFYSAGAAVPELCDRVARDYNRYKYYFRGTPFNSNFIFKNILSQLRSVAFVMKKDLDIDRFKVAVLAEKAIWADPVVAGLEYMLPKIGMEHVGTWRCSTVTKDLTAELKAIESAGPHILVTVINGPAGVTLGRQYGELKIPAAMLGVLSQAATLKYYDATQKKADYIMTSTTYTLDLEINELTKPFVQSYYQRYGEIPQYTANTYTIIRYTLVPAIEEAGTLNPDKLIPVLENAVTKIPAGVGATDRDEMGRPRHDLKWGPSYTTGIGAQWQDGKLVAVWPHFQWMSPYWQFSVEPPDKPNQMSYKGLQPYKIAPWIVAAYKKK